MTKPKNTELARIRAAAKSLRSAVQDAPVPATVQPAMAASLADARAIVARELTLMRNAQNAGQAMSLGDAKKLQVLMSSLVSSQTVEKGLAPDLENLSDAELEAEIKKLSGGA